MEAKRVYTFGNGHAEGKADMRNLLGGKGANLAEMNLIGVPVPPGFTITTACGSFERRCGESDCRNRGFDEIKIRQYRKSFVGICPFGSKSFYAGYDGYNIKSWIER